MPARAEIGQGLVSKSAGPGRYMVSRLRQRGRRV